MSGVSQPVDSSILHEIVRIIDSRRKVPDKVVVTSKEYLLTYLEDHRRRLEEALMRFDRDRLNMLYGQLASKVKYQMLRRVPAKAAAAVGMTKPAAKSPKPAGKSAKPAGKSAKPAAKAKGAKPAVRKASPPARKAAPAKPKPAAARAKTKKAKATPKPKAKAAARPKPRAKSRARR